MRNLKLLNRRSIGLAIFLISGGGMSASAQQSSPEFCIGLGHKPGSANYYRCLEAHQNVQPQGLDNLSKGSGGKQGESESQLIRTPEAGVGDSSGVTTEGATSPDPKLLKQLEQGDFSPKTPPGGKP